MEIYTVGGAIRDKLLGLPVKDRDFVVVGSTPEMMVAQGYLPVGKDFPVFLHPKTHEEYALARTERKSGSGYKGFVVHAAPEVTLIEDLARRDFTVNAIAQSSSGEYIDPYRGRSDLESRVFRHVSAAFAEDPVRILRAARFMARFTDFTIAPETLELMRNMVDAGEVDHLVAERVWQEMARGLMEARPSRMFDALRACGALARLMPEVDALFGVPQSPQYHPEIDTGIHTLMVLDYAAQAQYSLPVRFAALLHDLGKPLTPVELWPEHPDHEQRGEIPVKQLCARLRVPKECRDLAVVTERYHGEIHRVKRLSPSALVDLFETLDAFRRPHRLDEILRACLADARGRPGYEASTYEPPDYMHRVLRVLQQIDVAEIAASVPSADIARRIREARIAAIGRLEGGDGKTR